MKNIQIESFICDNDPLKQNDSISVIIPMFKRSNYYLLYKAISIQTFLPSYVIFQQSLHYIEIPDSIFNNSLFPVYYIWSPNWNMKYHAKLYFSSIFDTKYVVTIDDDQFFQSGDTFKNATSVLNKDNAIYGRYGTFNTRDPMNKPLKEYKSNENSYDHVGCIYFFSPRKTKIYLRYKPYTFSYGEDIGFCTTNNIECGTKSRTIEFPLKDTNKDEHRSRYWITQKPSDFKTYKNIRLSSISTLDLIKYKSYEEVYHYYKSIGFIPLNYKILNLTQKIVGDGKYKF
ncbi:hypothetical protein WA158_007947 [Blastocystis sp. Blastoise]